MQNMQGDYGLNKTTLSPYDFVLLQITLSIEGFKEIYSKPDSYEDEYGFSKDMLLHQYLDQANGFADDALRIRNGN